MEGTESRMRGGFAEIERSKTERACFAKYPFMCKMSAGRVS